jgi:hypothetical protein
MAVLIALLVVAAILVGYRIVRGRGAHHADEIAFAAHAAALGWRDESDARDDRWPIRFTGAVGDLPWTIWASPGPEDVEDAIWWATDGVRADEFVLVAGHARAGQLDWEGQVGVRDHTAIDRAAEVFLSEVDRATDVEALADRSTRDHPWLTIGTFLRTARDVSLPPPSHDVVVKAQDPDVARKVFDASALAALAECHAHVNSAGAHLRVWLGAPNLRIHLVTLIEDDVERRFEAMRHVVALGAAIASGFRRVRQSTRSRSV